MRITLVINPSSKDVLDALRAEVRRLREQGHEVVPKLTFERGDARRFGHEAASDGTQLLIASGGDGTIHAVLNGLHGFWTEMQVRGGEAPAIPRLGIVPTGTGNDLAGALGIPIDPVDAVRTAIHGVQTAADIATVNGLCFLNVSTGGFGAEATEEASPEIKRVLGPFAYVVTGAKKFVSLETTSARFESWGTIYDGPFLLFAVGNSQRTGGGNWLTPLADISDGMLDLCLVREVSRVELLGLLPELRAGTHLDHPAVEYHRVRELKITTEADLSVNADGEPVRGPVFHYAISPHRLTLMLPGPSQKT